ncbi:nitrogenase molybdenum-iron protein subunit beta [Syntrophotalea acetylenivorans]|uniref:Nitrogenase molybdenum-iron protein beta chain n=1 Tax=Syntrophotalea acetylenivorans TaxID=1842532 RepID=A0A1L3GKX3_9BACT|nr:nitrogenase molybdenum-iron protein subunit beta [Syntrophotalea acetylenivorans]APG26535.1 nitrogenase molybdenum-iron protein subunit beta [Syntrophotalea acetylenivorans]
MSEQCAVKKVTEITTEEVERIKEWINTEEYKEKNMAREGLVINPAHACQPLGAQLVAHGFEGTLPFVHGSQGCASYYRSAFNRHFREPAPAVSDAMTEDGAVFGGQNNLFEGLENAYTLYHPKMIAVFTSCMPEVIGDDLTAFIQNARNEGHIPADFPVPYANTPSFNGTHIHGYDPMLKSILNTLGGDKKVEGKDNGSLNLIPGFDACTGNYREYKRYMKAFDIPCTLMADISDSFDSPLTGTYNPYPGGTPLEDAADALNAHATIALQQYSTKETMKWFSANTDAPVETLPMPIGVKKTDELLMKISELFDKPVPQELIDERGRAVDAMTDAHQYLHNKKFAIYGDPDWLLGVVSFLLEMGARPYHILCSRSNKKFKKTMQELLDTSPYGADCNIWINKDLWHLRSLCATDPVDALIGDAHGKFITRDLGIPLIRAGFPIMDRVNLHRYPTIGYQGAINLLTWIANTFLDQVDVTCEDRNFEMMR